MQRLLLAAGLVLVAGCSAPEIAIQTDTTVQVDGGTYGQARDMAQTACARYNRNASYRQSVEVGGRSNLSTSRTFDCVAR